MRGTIKVRGLAAECAGSSVSGLSRMMSSIDGWSVAETSGGVEELSTGVGAAFDVVSVAVAVVATAAGSCGGWSGCWASSGVVASVDDRTMNWLSDVLLVSVLVGCVMFGK